MIGLAICALPCFPLRSFESKFERTNMEFVELLEVHPLDPAVFIQIDRALAYLNKRINSY